MEGKIIKVKDRLLIQSTVVTKFNGNSIKNNGKAKLPITY